MKLAELNTPLLYGEKVKIKESINSKYNGLVGIIKESNTVASVVSFNGMKKTVTIINSLLEKP